MELSLANVRISKSNGRASEALKDMWYYPEAWCHPLFLCEPGAAHHQYDVPF